jgi:Na+-translocating ferredoxin:NAD+ oxidoreductase RnfC subunit
VPISRHILKHGLHGFRNEGPLVEKPYAPRQVCLPFQQHAGAPARLVVQDGAVVRAGEVIARPEAGQLGAVVHASIAGTCRVLEDRVIITASPRGG